MVSQRRVARFFTNAALLLGMCGCERAQHESEPSFVMAVRTSEWRLPASAGSDCRDVGDFTVCFASGPAHAAKRALPALAAPSALGFRCWETGKERVCVDRLGAAGPFACHDDEAGRILCIQRAPRLPQGGIWDCGDDAGVVVCLGQDALPDVDAAWKCGQRRHADAGQRVCVDLSPDYPDGRAEGWDCRFEDDARAVGGRARTCVREPRAALVGVSCDERRPCVAGTLCTQGACAPNAPSADCIADQDCDGGVCRFGSCFARGEGP